MAYIVNYVFQIKQDLNWHVVNIIATSIYANASVSLIVKNITWIKSGIRIDFVVSV